MRPSEQLTDPHALESLVLRWAWFAVALLAVIVIGYWVGVHDIFKLAIFAGVTVFIAVTTLMRDRSWVLIPLAWALAGTSAFLPLQISIRDASILLVFSSFVTYAIVAQRNFRQKLHPLGVILAVNLVWALLSFIRHPVGLAIFGSETIGARPYFEMFFAVLAYWVIVRLPNSPKTVSRVPYFILAGSIAVALINLVVYIAPATTPIMHFLYQGVDIGSYIALGVGEETGVTRWGQFGPFGMTVIFVLCALYPPRSLINPLRPRFYAFVIGLGGILASGYRNFLLWALVALGLGSWFRRGWQEIVIGVVAGAVALGALTAGQGRLYQLPDTAQRTLSWLPGQWSTEVLTDAERSSESRFQWWKDVIKYDLIHNWWLGDGFGVSASDYTAFQSGRDFFGWMTLVGGFHNGPLTSIRAVGIVGMILFYIYMIAAAVYSVKCVQRCRGTPLQMIAIFLAIQLVWEPVHFTLVFGSYDYQMQETTFLVALLLLVMRMREQMQAEDETVIPVEPARPAFARMAGAAS